MTFICRTAPPGRYRVRPPLGEVNLENGRSLKTIQGNAEGRIAPVGRVIPLLPAISVIVR